MRTSTALLSLLAPFSVSAAPLASGHDSTLAERSAFPFSRVVAFGDNLSDNGNGSVAHGVASPGHPNNTIYGFRTWTDGPIAVSYLVDLLGVPLATDYAFGHAAGGSKFGATINNTYNLSPAGAPDAFEQLKNYTSTPGFKDDIAKTMHFLWFGANDISLKHIYVWPGFDYVNTNFANAMALQVAELVQRLVNEGAEYVFVPNLYAKNISPSKEFYTANAAELAKLTSTIELANSAIKKALVPFGKKAIYYDVYSFMMHVWQNHADYGITHVGGQFCDGYSQKDWDLCVTDHKGPTFYWMQYLDMTSYVHKLIAEDMYKALKAHFA